jgi:hypothetical protein
MRPVGTPDELERLLLRAVELLTQGHQPVEVARMVGANQRSVRRWKAAYRKKGRAALAARFFFAANYISSAADAQMWLSLAWAFLVVTAIAAILTQFYRWSSRFILTDRLVVLKNGILRQRTTKFPLRNVKSILWGFQS